jgi:hypothetical protein
MTPAQKPVISTHRGRKVVLGRRHVSPPVVGPARLMARRHLESLPPPAPARDWIKPAADLFGGNFSMFLNDQLGDCTIADGPAHCSQIWSAAWGKKAVVSEAAVKRAYETVCGYVDGDPSTDNGGIETEVLGAWRRGIEGFARLDGWIPVNPANIDHVRKAIERYGVVYIGVALPLTAQDQTVWTVDLGGGARSEAGSWGGHAISLSAYDQSSFDTITWGQRQKMSIDWFLTYCDEAYAPLCGTLWCPNGASPLGDSVAALTTDLQVIT